MKKLILLLAITGFFVQTQAQKLVAKKVPEVISAAFTRDNPSVKVVDWNRAGNTYIAMFTADKMDVSNTYDTIGKLIITVREISVKDLPSTVMEYVKTNYKDVANIKAFKTINADGVLTSYKLRAKDLNLLFDPLGTFVKEDKY